MGLALTTGPATEPVSLAQIKAQCKVTHNGEDDLLTSYGVAARILCEEITHRAFIEQRWELTLPWMPTGTEPIYLPRPRLILNGVVGSYSPNFSYYVDEATGDTLTNNTDYVVNYRDEPAYLVPYPGLEWPVGSSYLRPNNVTISFLAGYSSAAGDVPTPIKQAILMLCSHWYKFREPIEMGSFQDVPYAVEHLLSPYMTRHQIPIGALT